MKTDDWSTDYARSLTKDQWTGELESRFFDDICREITSLAVREPVRLALEQHSLEALGDNEHSNWKIYNVSISYALWRVGSHAAASPEPIVCRSAAYSTFPGGHAQATEVKSDLNLPASREDTGCRIGRSDRRSCGISRTHHGAWRVSMRCLVMKLKNFLLNGGV